MSDQEKILDLRTGQELTFTDLIGRLVESEVIFIGEMHTHPEQHRRQLDIIDHIHDQNPYLVIGLELFERSRQELLDQWLAGTISEQDFKTAVLEDILGLETFQVYFPLLLWARERKIPLLALNAPRSVTAKVARGGLESLDQDDNRLIARDIVVGPPPYRQRVAKAFVHHQGQMDLDHFFSAQVVWDETMAETLSEFLNSPWGQGRKAMVIAGNEHIWGGYGLPDRVARRYEGVQARLIMPLTSEKEALTGDVADFAWISSPAHPAKRRRLGIKMTKDDLPGLKVVKVLENSLAEEAGLTAGDRLLVIDGRLITSPLDLHRAAVHSEANQEHVLTVKRGQREFDVVFRFAQVK